MSAEKAFRYDHGQLRSPVRTPQGFLRVDGYVGRAGIYEYVNTEADARNGYGAAGTIRRELRPEEEVYRADVLAGFEGAPLTATHPQQEITAANVRAYEVGTSTTAARRDGNRVAASMVIKDPKAIARVESGELVELSPGYKAVITKRAGTDKRYATASNPEGRYDCVQSDIEINHLALVPRARGGSDLRLRMDGVDDVAEERNDNDLTATSRGEIASGEFADPETRKLPIENAAHVRAAMSRFSQTEFQSDAAKRTARNKIIAAAHKFGIDTAGFEAAHRTDSQTRNDTMNPDEQIRALKLQIEQLTATTSERKDALDTVTAERDAANAKLKTLGDRVTALEATLAAGATAMETEAIAKQSARADAAESELNLLKQKRDEDIRLAAEMRIKAKAVMGPEFRVDGMSDRQVRAVVIKRFAPQEDVGEKVSDAYVASRFDSLVEAHMQNALALTRAGEVLSTTTRRTEQRTDSKEARAQAWRDQALPKNTQADGRKDA